MWSGFKLSRGFLVFFFLVQIGLFLDNWCFLSLACFRRQAFIYCPLGFFAFNPGRKKEILARRRAAQQQQYAGGGKNTLITSLCSNLFQALQFTPALCFQVLQNAMSLIPDWLLCCRIVSAPALLVRHFFFSPGMWKKKKRENFSVSLSASLHSNQCNYLIDHLYIIGITWSFMLQSMLAMLQSPRPPRPPPSPHSPPTLLPSALLVLSPGGSAPLLRRSASPPSPPLFFIDCRVSRRVFKPSLM